MEVGMFLTIFALRRINRKHCPTPLLRLFKTASWNFIEFRHSIACTNPLILICVSTLGLHSPTGRTRLHNISNNNRRTTIHGLATDKYSPLHSSRHFSAFYSFNFRKANVYYTQQNLPQYGAHNYVVPKIGLNLQLLQEKWEVKMMRGSRFQTLYITPGRSTHSIMFTRGLQ
jgi:hypothetical protein